MFGNKRFCLFLPVTPLHCFSLWDQAEQLLAGFGKMTWPHNKNTLTILAPQIQIIVVHELFISG